MDIIITELNEKHKALKLLESQMAQRRARLLTKQPGFFWGGEGRDHVRDEPGFLTMLSVRMKQIRATPMQSCTRPTRRTHASMQPCIHLMKTASLLSSLIPPSLQRSRRLWTWSCS